MIPTPITWGHVLMLLALVALAYGALHLTRYLSYRTHGRGTPGYARARDGRRFAIWSVAVAALLFAIGCLTPLAALEIG
jgi:low temperature requirement protein LtrA